MSHMSPRLPTKDKSGAKGTRTPDPLHAIRLRRGSEWVRKGVSGQFTCEDVSSKSLAGSRSVQRMADRMADRTKGDDGMFERARRGTRRLRHPNLEFRRMLVLVTNPLDLYDQDKVVGQVDEERH